MCSSHVKLRGLVRKNLAGHQSRNRKTAQMFTICLAFIIFTGSMFSLQTKSIIDNVKVFVGADIIVFAPTLTEELDEASMSTYLEQEVQNTKQGNGILIDYTFVTFAMGIIPEVNFARISNLPRFPEVRNQVFGIQSNYMNVADVGYYVVTEVAGKNVPQTRNGRPDAISLMFTDAGNARLPEEEQFSSIRVPPSIASGSSTNISSPVVRSNEEAYVDYIDIVVSEALRDFCSVTTSTPINLKVSQSNPTTQASNEKNYLAKSRGLVSKVPGFFFFKL